MKKTLLFFLLLFSTLFYAQVNNIEHCAEDISFNLTAQKPLLIGNLNPAETTVSYHVSLADANNNLNAIANPSNYITTNSQIIYARIDNLGTITTNYFRLILNSILIANTEVVYVNCIPRIVITGTGGNQNYEYSHFGVTYTQNNIVINPSPGSQTVYVRDGNGCVVSKSLIVESLSPLTWRAQRTNVTCQGANDGTIEITASGGKAPYSFSLANENEFTNSNVFKNLSVGTYTIYIKDATGCVISLLMDVYQANPSIVIAATITNDSNATNEGKIDLNVSGGVLPYNYFLKDDKGIIIPSKTTNPFTGLSAGSYQAYIIDSQGCTSSQAVNISNAPTPLTTTSKVTPITCVITTGTITITPNGGTLPYQYSIDNGNNYSNSNVFSNLDAGTYNLKVLDGQNAVVSAIATIDPIKMPEITVTYKNVLCHGDTNGSILVGASNGKSPNLFSINGGAYSSYNLFENLPAGNYTLSVKDSNGCIVSKSVILDDPAPITAQVTFLDRFVTINASGGYGKYDYALDGGNYQQSNIYLNVSYGNHTIYVKDPNNCILAQPITVVKPVPLASSFSIDKGTVTITTTGGVLPYRYSLQNAKGYTIITTQSNIFTDLINGSYKIIVNDSQGSSFTLFDVIISESIAITANATSTPVNCNGLNGTITVTTTGGKSPYQYSLNSANFSNSNIFSNLNVGNYSITVRDSNNFTAITSVSISNAPPVLVTAEILAEINCFDSNDGIIKAKAIQGQAPFTYAIDNANFQDSDTFINLSPGIHTIQALDKNNCASSVSVTLLPPSRIDAAIVVNGKTITASATGGTFPYTYSLLNNSGVFIEPQPSNEFTNLPSGLYSLQIVDKRGCLKVLNDILIPQPTIINATTLITPISCDNPKAKITVLATGGSGSYEYSINNTTNYSPANVFSGLSDGNYTITIKDDQNNIVSITVTISPFNTLKANAVATKIIDCINNGSINVTASGGTKPYKYSLDNGINYTDSNVFTNINAGSYSVRVKDSLDCTITTNSIIFEQLVPLKVSINYSNPSAFDSNDGSITVFASEGTGIYNYTLTNNNGITLIADQPSNIFNNLAAGTYVVIVKDSKDCSEQRQVIIVAPKGSLSAIATIIQPNCSNPRGIITVTATGGSVPYQYSIDGSNYYYSNVFNVTQSGNYIITVRDYENTSYTLNAAVFFMDPLILSATYSTLSSCNSDGTITAIATGGQVPYSYSLNGSSFENTNVFNNLDFGIYSIQAKDANGCTQNVIVKLFQPTLLSASVTTNDLHITVTAAGGTGDYKYSLDGINFQSSNIFTVLNYGAYNVFIRDQKECLVIVTTNLNPPSPLLDGKTIIIVDFKSGQTLGDLVVEGQNIKWYSSPKVSTGKTNKSAEINLPLSTVLVDGVTYYASQTINGIESTERLAVTAKLDQSLSAPDFVLPNFKYYPNPVQHTLTIDNTSTVDEIEIISVSGKSILTKKINNTHSEIDLSNVSTGFYFLKVKSEGQVKIIKIVKK